MLMNIKDRKMLCRTCLSKDRNMYAVQNLKLLLQEIKMDEMDDVEGDICWECVAVLKKIVNFKKQVTNAQKILRNMRKQSNLGSLSSLKSVYFTENTHLINVQRETKIKSERVSVEPIEKVEIDVKDTISHNDMKLEGDNRTETDIDAKNQVMIKVEPTQEDAIDVEDPISYKDLKDDNFTENDNEIKKQNDVKNEYSGVEPMQKVEVYIEASVSFSDMKNEEDRVTISKNDDEIHWKYTKTTLTEEQMKNGRKGKAGKTYFKRSAFKCESCVISFTKKENMDVHMANVHNKFDKYVCPVCRSGLPTQLALSTHLDAHYTRYKCNLCTFDTHDASEIRSHANTHDDTTQLRCKDCEKICRTLSEVKEHVSIGHMLTPMCETCGEKYATLRSLKKHKRNVHAPSRSNTCQYCNKQFPTRSRLEGHLVKHDKSLLNKLSYCTECCVQYKSIYVYRQHMRTSPRHTNERYNCEECQKVFPSKKDLQHHINITHLKISYTCDTCSKTFYRKWMLRRHIVTQHLGLKTKNYTCNVCGEIFHSRVLWQNHSYTHPSERTFMCSVCGETYKQSIDLFNHTRTVHDGYRRSASMRVNATPT